MLGKRRANTPRSDWIEEAQNAPHAICTYTSPPQESQTQPLFLLHFPPACMPLRIQNSPYPAHPPIPIILIRTAVIDPKRPRFARFAHLCYTPSILVARAFTRSPLQAIPSFQPVRARLWRARKQWHSKRTSLNNIWQNCAPLAHRTPATSPAIPAPGSDQIRNICSRGGGKADKADIFTKHSAKLRVKRRNGSALNHTLPPPPTRPIARHPAESTNPQEFCFRQPLPKYPGHTRRSSQLAGQPIPMYSFRTALVKIGHKIFLCVSRSQLDTTCQ